MEKSVVNYESALKAQFNLAHGNAMGRERTRQICALKGQHIVENKYIALSGRRFTLGHLFNPWRCHGLKYLWLSAIILRASSFCLLFEYFNGGLGMTSRLCKRTRFLASLGMTECLAINGGEKRGGFEQSEKSRSCRRVFRLPSVRELLVISSERSERETSNKYDVITPTAWHQNLNRKTLYFNNL